MVSPNVIVGAEFLHTVYADSAAPLLEANGPSACGGGINPGANCVIRNNITTDVARVRVNFKLN